MKSIRLPLIAVAAALLLPLESLPAAVLLDTANLPFTGHASRGTGSVAFPFTVTSGIYQVDTFQARIRDNSSTSVEPFMSVSLIETDALYLTVGPTVATFSWTDFPNLFTDVVFTPDSPTVLNEGQHYLFVITNTFVTPQWWVGDTSGGFTGQANFSIPHEGRIMESTATTFSQIFISEPRSLGAIINGSAIPEPSRALLTLLGLGAVLARRRR